MRISLNCPSYKRPYVETLEYLPFCKVWVDEGEYQAYKEANPEDAQIISVPKGIQGNLCRIRNYILDTEFDNGFDVVVIIDDDLKGMYRHTAAGHYGYEKKKIETDQFMDFLQHFSLLCDEFGYKFWGVNCNMDAMGYRHYTPFSTTSYIGGPFQAHLKNELRYDESLPLKEDYDMTLQHMNKYRGALRANMYFYNCKQSEQAGGCATYRNYEREKQQFFALQKKWGERIVKQDKRSKKQFDYNPIIKIPIRGV